MTFDEVLTQALDLLRRQGRVSYRALKRRFDLDDEYIEDLKAEIIQAQRLAIDEDGAVLVWTGETAATAAPAQGTTATPLSYTPKHLAEKLLTSRAALEGERKQVTVLFADIKGSMAMLEDLDHTLPSFLALLGVAEPRALCQQIGETPQLLPVLWGLASFYAVRAAYQAAWEVGEQLLSLA